MAGGGGVTHGMELQWVRLDRGLGALQENLSTDLIKQKGGGGIKEREQRGGQPCTRGVPPASRLSRLNSFPLPRGQACPCSCRWHRA